MQALIIHHIEEYELKLLLMNVNQNIVKFITILYSNADIFQTSIKQTN